MPEFAPGSLRDLPEFAPRLLRDPSELCPSVLRATSECAPSVARVCYDRAPIKLRHEHGRGRRSSQKTDPELRSVKRLHPVEAPDLHQAFLPNSERFGCKGTTFFQLFQIMLYYSSEITAFFQRSDTGERSELAPSKPRQKL